MTYRQSAAELAAELASLAISRASEQLDADGLDLALLGRNSVLRTVRSTLATVTRHDPGPFTTRPARIDDLITAPVSLLQRELAAYPMPPVQVSLIDRMAFPPRSATKLSWYTIAKHAHLAGHDFTDLNSRLQPEHRWTVVADVGAIARTLHILDGHLLRAAQLADSPAADELRQTGKSALPYCAEEAIAVARSGPLPDLDTAAPDTTPLAPVHVTGPTFAVAAQTALHRQLLSADDLSPEVIGIVALTQARLMNAASHLLAQDDPARAARAAAIAASLSAIRAHDPQLAALVPGDQRPHLQSRELARYLQEAVKIDPRTRQGARVRQSLAALVDRAPGIITALEQATDRQLFAHRWAVAYAGEEADAPMWGIWTAKLDRPRLLTQLEKARTQIIGRHTPTAGLPPDYTPIPHPHQTLADVPRTRIRPREPARHVGLDR